MTDEKFFKADAAARESFVRSRPPAFLHFAIRLFERVWIEEDADEFLTSQLFAVNPAVFTEAMIHIATEHPELPGWRRDQLYDVIDSALDAYLGLNVREVEMQIAGTVPSVFGEAAWSEANPETGWLTNYADFYLLLQELRLAPGALLIDIGSGHGRTGFLIGLLFAQLRYEGYEIVPERARIAEKIADRAKFANVSFKLADIAALEPLVPADVYYLYDALNEPTVRFLLDRIPAGARLCVRDGKGLALSCLANDARFKKLKSFVGDERLQQSVFIYERRES